MDTLSVILDTLFILGIITLAVSTKSFFSDDIGESDAMFRTMWILNAVGVFIILIIWVARTL